MSDWHPDPQSVKLLDYAMAKVKSVPYKVCGRWVFYRVLQAGLLRDKKQITTFDYLTSRARKTFYGEWRPDTLIDSIRQPCFKGEQYVGFWIELDSMPYQNYYVQLWFEARAMHPQFEYFTRDYRASLVPFGGDYSIPKKWEVAKKLEAMSAKYEKPVKILYYRDCDRKGFQIPKAALKDIRAWCSVPFDFETVGLTEEQAKGFGLPENPEKPGSFQWEALDDRDAKKLIVDEGVARYLHPVPATLREREVQIRERARKSIWDIMSEELRGN
jgi:hypothetical protein